MHVQERSKGEQEKLIPISILIYGNFFDGDVLSLCVLA